MNAVGKAAMEMVYEVRRQFKEIPGIMEGKGKPEYDKCVDISTKASLKQMMASRIINYFISTWNCIFTNVIWNG